MGILKCVTVCSVWTKTTREWTCPTLQCTWTSVYTLKSILWDKCAFVSVFFNLKREPKGEMCTPTLPDQVSQTWLVVMPVRLPSTAPYPYELLHSYLLLELSLAFCRLLTDTVSISSIPSCQIKSVCSNEIPIHPLSTALIPVPSGRDRFAGNDLFRIDFPLHMRCELWSRLLTGSSIVADFWFLFNLLVLP